MKAHALIGVAAVTALGSAATADIALDFDGLTAEGLKLFKQNPNPLEGVLDSVTGSFVLDAGTGFTYASDLVVIIANEDLTDILVQIGANDLFTTAPYRYEWQYGEDDAPGTLGGGFVNTSLSGVGHDVTGYYLWLGNGLSMPAVSGTWSGSISLEGSIDYVPAPGVLALLGIAGLASRRRRA